MTVCFPSSFLSCDGASFCRVTVFRSSMIPNILLLILIFLSCDGVSFCRVPMAAAPIVT